jgi:ABC-2 type transport system permease protein
MSGPRPSALGPGHRFLSHLLAMLRKEFLQMRRDRLTLGMLLGLPAAQIVVFGFLVGFEVRHIPMVVLDESRTAESRALATALANTQSFDYTGDVRSRAEVDRLLRDGRARAALVVPPDYARRLLRGRPDEPAEAQLVVDASDPLTAQGAVGAAALVGAARAATLRDENPSAGVSRAPPRVEVRVRPRYNPALRSAVFIVPGLVGVVLTLTLVMITSMSLVREREAGTLEQLIVTPIGKGSVVVGKILPFVLVGFIQLTVVLLLGRFLFRIPMRGSLVLLYGITLLFMLALLGLALLFSTLARTQAQAIQMGLLTVLPSVLLSGFVFPIASMPRPARAVAQALPFTHYIEAVRAILLRGAGVEALWSRALVLALFALVVTSLSVRRFAKTLE